MANEQETRAATIRRRIYTRYIGTVPPSSVLSEWADQELIEQAGRVAERNAIHRRHMNELREQGGTSSVA